MKNREKREMSELNKLPTFQQLCYLIELEAIGGQKGNISRVAEKCNVNSSSVSRYFKICQDKGYLEQDNTFTKQGTLWLKGYKNIIQHLPAYLQKIGIGKKEIPYQMQCMIENLEYHVLEAMIRNVKNSEVSFARISKEDNILGVLEKGNQDIGFMIFKYGKTREFGISMADKAFEKPALLSNNKRGQWIYLNIKEVEEKSRVYRTLMSGILKTLKYEQEEVLKEALIKDNKVRLPLSAFRFRKKKGGEVQGELAIMVTCSVGRIHMPESTALLVIWL